MVPSHMSIVDYLNEKEKSACSDKDKPWKVPIEKSDRTFKRLSIWCDGHYLRCAGILSQRTNGVGRRRRQP
ncbi:hypothetical protein TNCV_2286441 [Trichonephila clavipes]|nr:hypothetical protein TNCV_2286441 [Trichonephila clavipes]